MSVIGCLYGHGYIEWLVDGWMNDECDWVFIWTWIYRMVSGCMDE